METGKGAEEARPGVNLLATVLDWQCDSALVVWLYIKSELYVALGSDMLSPAVDRSGS